MLNGIFVLIDYFKNFEKLNYAQKFQYFSSGVIQSSLFSTLFDHYQKNDSKLEIISDCKKKILGNKRLDIMSGICLWALHEGNTYRNIIRAFLAFCWIMILYNTHRLKNWWSTHIYIVMDMFRASIMHYRYSVYVYTYII